MAFTWLTWDRVQSVSKCMTRQAGEQSPVHTMHVCTHMYLHAHTRMYVQIISAFPSPSCEPELFCLQRHGQFT